MPVDTLDDRAGLGPPTFLADCIEAGLPYDWARFNIDQGTEAEIMRAVLAATDTARVEVSPSPPTGKEGHPLEGEAPVPAERTPASELRAESRGDGCTCFSTRAGVEPKTHCTCSADARSGLVVSTQGPRGGGAASSSASSGPDESVSSGLSSQKTGFRGSATNAEGATIAAETENTAGGEGLGVVGTARRWESVRLGEVKRLAPGAEYWQIRMLLARLRSGWSGH